MYKWYMHNMSSSMLRTSSRIRHSVDDASNIVQGYKTPAHNPQHGLRVPLCQIALHCTHCQSRVGHRSTLEY
jgi:hypothetical protein